MNLGWWIEVQGMPYRKHKIHLKQRKLCRGLNLLGMLKMVILKLCSIILIFQAYGHTWVPPFTLQNKRVRAFVLTSVAVWNGKLYSNWEDRLVKEPNFRFSHTKKCLWKINYRNLRVYKRNFGNCDIPYVFDDSVAGLTLSLRGFVDDRNRKRWYIIFSVYRIQKLDFLTVSFSCLLQHFADLEVSVCKWLYAMNLSPFTESTWYNIIEYLR